MLLSKLGWDHIQICHRGSFIVRGSFCHLMLHFLQLFVLLKCFVYCDKCGCLRGSCWRWKLEYIIVLLCWLLLAFILCNHMGLHSRVAADQTYCDCTVTLSLTISLTYKDVHTCEEILRSWWVKLLSSEFNVKRLIIYACFFYVW